MVHTLRHDVLTRGIPMVMISDNLHATEQFHAQRFGADDFMKKTFGRGEVFARIRHLTESGRLVMRERAAEESLRQPEHTEAERAAIPDIAMPNPQDLLMPPGDRH